MSRSSRFFRGLWRVNAVLFFVMTAIITVAALVILVQELGPKLARSTTQKVMASGEAETPEDQRLEFDNASIAERSGVITVDLVSRRDGEGPSSGTTTVTRNILFIEPGQNAAHWLLADNAHQVNDQKSIYDRPESDAAKVIGNAVIVRPFDVSEDTPGRLLVYDLTAGHTVELSKAATKVELASLSGGEMYVLYRNGSRFMRATLDPATMAKRSETEIEVPKVK